MAVRTITRTDDEWRAILTAEQFRIMRRHGTEPPYSCAADLPDSGGTYTCAGCGLPLFRAGKKFESGTGWPSYTEPVAPDHVEEISDTSLGLVRTEVRCAACGSHIGHVFDDGPPPGGRRYCINSVCLIFVPDPTP